MILLTFSLFRLSYCKQIIFIGTTLHFPFSFRNLKSFHLIFLLLSPGYNWQYLVLRICCKIVQGWGSGWRCRWNWPWVHGFGGIMWWIHEASLYMLCRHWNYIHNSKSLSPSSQNCCQKCVINFLLLLIQQKKLLWVILIGGPQNYHFTWGSEKIFSIGTNRKIESIEYELPK